MDSRLIKPNLVSDKTIRRLDKIFNKISPITTPWPATIGSFYEDYISPNLFGLIAIIIVILYLSMRYLIKQSNIEKNKKSKTDLPEKQIKEQFIII